MNETRRRSVSTPRLLPFPDRAILAAVVGRGSDKIPRSPFFRRVISLLRPGSNARSRNCSSRFQYDADLQSLEATRNAEKARLQQSYLAVLDAEEKAATASGKLTEVGAILKARAAVSAQSEAGVSLTGLSKTQEKRYSDYFAALTSADREFASRWQLLTGDYLRSLALIKSRLPANAPAREQIDKRHQAGRWRKLGDPKISR